MLSLKFMQGLLYFCLPALTPRKPCRARRLPPPSNPIPGKPNSSFAILTLVTETMSAFCPNVIDCDLRHCHVAVDHWDLSASDAIVELRK
jgi:hypothetical protein